MRVLVHLSDLHFGRIAPSLLEPLRQSIESETPNLVVVSGDLTQRARPAQFREARAFLDRLPGIKLVVPGNHDVPLYNLYRRFVDPLGRFRRHFSADAEPEYLDDEIAVLGVNTARSAVLKGGRINERQMARVRARFCRLDSGIVKIVVTHHPFDAPRAREPQLVGRAAQAVAQFERCGADVLLSGHLHASHAGDTSARYRSAGHAALVVQAGTATSTRGRGEANAFNVLRVERTRVAVEPRVWDGRLFRPEGLCSFERSARGWRRAA